MEPRGGSSPRGRTVAEVGPVPSVAAPEYLLRTNVWGGRRAARRRCSHPGLESFYVLAGELGQTTSHGTSHVGAGQSMVGHEPGMAMEVLSSGDGSLTALVMFIVDVGKPFSSPAALR